MRDETFKVSATSSIVKSLVTVGPEYRCRWYAGSPLELGSAPTMEFGRSCYASFGVAVVALAAAVSVLVTTSVVPTDLRGRPRRRFDGVAASRSAMRALIQASTSDLSHATAFRPSETGFGNVPLRIAS